MAKHISDTGAVTSWANNTPLISGGSAPTEFNLSLEADTHDVTAFTASIKSTGKIAGLRKATATIRTRMSPAKIGATGLVTHSAGYATSSRAWKIDMSWPVHDVTEFSGSGVNSYAYMPGLISWSGSYDAFVLTDAAVPQAGGASASATFKIIENSSNDQTLAGNVIISKIDPKNKVGDVCMATVSFVGDGDLAAAGTSGSGIGAPFITAISAVVSATGSLVLTSSTGKTYTGDAFPSRIAYDVAVNGVITVEATAQFTGDITIA